MIFDRSDLRSIKLFSKDAFSKSNIGSDELAKRLGCDRNNLYMAWSNNTNMRSTLYEILIELGYTITLDKRYVLINKEGVKNE